MDDVVNRVKICLVAIHSPSTTPSCRQEANAHVQDILTGGNALTVGIQLLSADGAPSSIDVHAGLTFITHAIRCCWSTTSPAEWSVLRECLLRWIDALQTMYETNPLCHNAFVRCIVHMMIQCWPQHWTQLTDKFTLILNEANNASQCKFVIDVWTRLLQDVCTMPVTIPATRRSDLNSAVCQYANTLLTTAYTCLANEQSPPSVHNSCLLMLCELLDHATVSHLCASDPSSSTDEECARLLAPLNTVLCVQLMREHTMSNALQVYLVIAARKEQALHMLLFAEPPITALVHMTELILADPDHYELLKLISQLLANVGHHLCTNPLPTLPPTFPLYMDMVMALYKHDSLFVNSNASSILASFVHQTHLVDRVHPYVVDGVLPNVARVYRKFGSPDSTDDAECASKSYAMAVQDYDNDEQFARQVGRMREWNNRLLVHLVGRETCTQTIHLITAGATGLIDAPNFSAVDWETCNRMGKVVMEAVYKQGKMDETNVASIDALFTKVVDQLLESTDMVLCNELLSTMSACATILHVVDAEKQADIVDNYCKVIERLLSLPIPVSEPDRTHVISLFRHALSDMHRIAHDFPSLGQSARLLRVATVSLPILSLQHAAALMSFVAQVANQFEGEEERKHILGMAVQTTVQYFQQDQVVAGIASPSSLLYFLGYTVTPPLSAEDEVVTRRKTFRAHLTLLENVCNNAVSPSALLHAVTPIMQQLFTLFRSLCEAHNETTASLIHDGYGGQKVLLAPSNEERLMLTATMMADVDCNEQTSDNTNENFTMANNFCYEMISKTVTVLGVVLCKCFPLIAASSGDRLDRILQTCCVQCLCDLPQARLRLVCRKLWKHIFTVTSKTNCFTPILPSICALTALLHERMNIGWESVRGLQGDDLNLIESSALVLSREVLGLYSTTLCEASRGKHPKSDIFQCAKQLSPFGEALVLESQQIVALLFDALSYGDLKCVTMALSMLPPIVLRVVQSSPPADLLRFMLMKSITAVQTHGQAEDVANRLILLVANICIVAQECGHGNVVTALLLELPSTTAASVESVGKQLGRMPTDKVKKEIVRKLLRPIIGESVATRFAYTVEVNDLLPPLTRPSRRKEEPKDVFEGEHGICSLFA